MRFTRTRAPTSTRCTIFPATRSSSSIRRRPCATTTSCWISRRPRRRLLLADEAEDRVLRGFRDAELHDLLGRDLDRLARRRVAADARLAVHEHEFAEAGDGEALLRFLV